MKPEYIAKAKQLLSNGYTPLLLEGKKPTWKGWQNAVVALDKVTTWWIEDETGERVQKQYPGIDDWNGPYNLGLRTGDNGLIVLDFDGLPGYEAFVEAFPALGESYTVKTGSGNGMHVYLIAPEPVKARAGLKLPGGAHMEIKAAGGQVVIPPSIHPETHQPYVVYKALQPLNIDTLQPFLDWIGQFQPKYEPVQREMVAASEAGEYTAYAKQALSNMAGDLARMSNTKDDYQNTTCNKMAWKLAHFVRHGDLAQSEVRNALEGAMSANGYIAAFGRPAFDKTFDSGFNDGYGDKDFEPQVYRKQSESKQKKSADWQAQRKPDRQLPGDWQAYEPSVAVKKEDGVVIIGRTRVVKRQTLFSDLLERIQDDKHIPASVPIRFPLKSLHHLGGQARISQAGKVFGLVGASGSGKTSALETILDAYAENGTVSWVWTPEWTPAEMAERALQRHDGVTQDQLYEQDIDNYNVNVLGLPSNPASRIPENQWAIAANVFRKLRSWKEDVYFVHNVLLTIDELAEVIAGARGICDPFPRVMILDYVQLLKANNVDDQEDRTIYNLIQRFKAMCGHYGMLGWVATQTTKEEARRAAKEGDFKGSTVLNVTKNSRGRTGKIRLPSEPSRLRIIDQPHPNQMFSEDAYYLGSQAGRYVNDDPYNLFITLNPEHE